MIWYFLYSLFLKVSLCLKESVFDFRPNNIFDPLTELITPKTVVYPGDPCFSTEDVVSLKTDLSFICVICIWEIILVLI